MGKVCYQAPRVLKTTTVMLEKSFLESVMKGNSKVKTTGQEVVNKDFSGSNFVQDWDSSPFTNQIGN